jgi:hypothetical protein
MSGRIQLSIGDIGLALVPAGADCRFKVEERFRPFLGDGQPDVVLRVHCGRMPDVELGPKVFDTNLGWRLYRGQGAWIVHVRSAEWDPYQLAVLEPDFRGGEIYVRANDHDPGQYGFPLGRPMGEVFMINLLARGYGLLLHACGVKVGEKGLLFAGTGGAGKSTMAGLWAGRAEVSILGDDHIIVREREGRFWMYGTPWPGQGGVFSPEAAPLERIFVLQHAEENRLLPLSPRDAASRLLVRSFATFWDAEGMAFTAGFLGRLSQAVPCYELGFLPDERVLDLCDA